MNKKNKELFKKFDDRMKGKDPMWREITKKCFNDNYPEEERIILLLANMTARALDAEKFIEELYQDKGL